MIEVSGLTKRYGRETAVDQISFTIQRGEIVGFLGPNGAGKTTTMRMLTGYLPPTAGGARLAGHDVVAESLEVRRSVGYLPESTPLYPDLSVREYLHFIGGLRGLSGEALTSGVTRAVESCGLGRVLEKDVGELSKGFRQRVGIAQAILHNPDILILDEPTSGLDPSQVVEVRELITALGKEKTVILSTHVLSEVQAVSSRVIIIARGKIVADGRIDELRQKHTHPGVISVQLRADEGSVRSKLTGLKGARTVAIRTVQGVVHADVDTTDDLRESIFRLAVSEGWTLLELTRREAGLEEIFLEQTGSLR